MFLLYKSNHELFFHIVNIVLNSYSWAIRLQASPGELSASTFGGPLAAFVSNFLLKCFPMIFKGLENLLLVVHGALVFGH